MKAAARVKVKAMLLLRQAQVSGLVKKYNLQQFPRYAILLFHGRRAGTGGADRACDAGRATVDAAMAGHWLRDGGIVR